MAAQSGASSSPANALIRLPPKMLDAYPVDVDARDTFSDLGQSFTSRTADDWADCANSEDWGSPPSPCGGTLQDEEKTAGPDGLVADGTPNLPPQFGAPGDHQLSPAQALSATSTGGFVTLSARARWVRRHGTRTTTGAWSRASLATHPVSRST